VFPSEENARYRAEILCKPCQEAGQACYMYYEKSTKGKIRLSCACCEDSYKVSGSAGLGEVHSDGWEDKKT
jgi:hypothetical protein